MRFLHFHQTEDYMKYLECTDVEQQRASNAYLHMTETEFLALDSKAGRRYAACNILGLVKFWEKQWELDNEIEGNEEDVENKEDVENEEDMKSEEDMESEYVVDEAVSGRNDDNINSDDLVGYEGNFEINADNSPKVRKRKRCSF